jgi:iron complex outermembrane receptor protein
MPMRTLLCLLLALVLGPAAGAASAGGTIEGKVMRQGGEAAEGVTVSLVTLRRQTTTDAAGAYRFEDVRPGAYLLEFSSPRYGTAVTEVVVAAGETVSPQTRIDLAVHTEEVVVSAAGDPRSLSDVAQPVTVLDGATLQEKVQPTLGETLAREPGISATSYSPGVSRPVIRGFGGDRIRVLENGVGVGDASNVSEDHAVSTDPLAAERIEVVRGPATLMYGSNAVGGVVNILDHRIPDHLPDTPMVGAAEVRYGSNAEEMSGGASLDGRLGSVGWHVDGVRRKTDDYDTPEGRLLNSDVDTTAATAGASWIAKRGFFGLSYGGFDTNYGIPNPDEPVRIDLEQRRWDAQGEYNAPLGLLRSVRLRLGRSDYEHVEIEDTGEAGNTFFNESWEGRVELPHRELGPFLGEFGVQYTHRDFTAVGEEAFVPPTQTENAALFLFEEIGAEPLKLELGARYEHQNNSADDPVLPERTFDALSGSAGVVWKPVPTYALSASVSRSARPPVAEELYANGPHLATFQFQVGDPNLSEETAMGLDLSFRRLTGRVTGELTLFGSRFDDYIFLQPTGSDVDVDGEPIPEFRYVQTDAEYTGGELHVDVELLHREPHHLELELTADRVRAEERGSGQPLPRITPGREGVGIRYQGKGFWGLLEARWTEEQDRVAAFETGTPGYTWINASVGYRLLTGRRVHDFVLRGLNLTDELARNHLSPLKEVVPLAGRDVSFSYRLTF